MQVVTVVDNGKGKFKFWVRIFAFYCMLIPRMVKKTYHGKKAEPSVGAPKAIQHCIKPHLGHSCCCIATYP